MYDIFFVSNDFNKSIKSLEAFKKRFPMTKKASSLEEANRKSVTKFFWIVWNDIEVLDSFDFSYKPDDGSQTYIHVFKNGNSYDGICLVPKNIPISKREIEYRFFINKKEVDILASISKSYDIFTIDSYDEYLEALEKTTTSMFWMTSSNIRILDDFDLNFRVSDIHDKNENHVFIHKEDNVESYDGLFLCSTKKLLTKREVEHRFPVSRKEWNIVATVPVVYDVFTIDSYEEYLEALEKTTYDMFWMTSRNIKILDTFDLTFRVTDKYHKNENHVFIHRVKDKDFYNGLFLCSTKKLLTKREVEHRFPVSRKEWDIVATIPVVYDIFTIDSYEEYLEALANSKTEMFWIIPKEIKVNNTFNFSNYYFDHSNLYDRTNNHVFKNIINNKENYDGIMLVPKNTVLSKREIEFRCLIDRKEYDIVASMNNNNQYDIIFISYNEPNADENYEKLKDRFLKVKRIHGVKGIHQAHIAAAKLAETDMFWVVDGDAQIVNSFDFSYIVSRHERDIVHVWESKNPINDLSYGYGGVKLLPKSMTANMDINSVDMTTSISNKFKPMPIISNITAFNTDPFNTWKSAFRECVKLSSKSIDDQIDCETTDRLYTWCTVGIDNLYGEYAIRGAIAGKEFGLKYSDNKSMLSKINDWEWLTNEFNKF